MNSGVGVTRSAGVTSYGFGPIRERVLRRCHSSTPAPPASPASGVHLLDPPGPRPAKVALSAQLVCGGEYWPDAPLREQAAQGSAGVGSATTGPYRRSTRRATSRAAQTQPAGYISEDPIGPDLTADFEGLTNSNVAYPWNPKPGSTNSTIPGSFAYNVNWDQTTQDFILDPYNINWWQGGAENVITQEKALELTMAGFGDCIGPAPADAVAQPQGLGPYGSQAINQ